MTLLGNRKAAKFFPHSRCAACGRLPIVACCWDMAERQNTYWLECPNDACDSAVPMPDRSRGAARDAWNKLQAYVKFAAWHGRVWGGVYRCPTLAELECPVERAQEYYAGMYRQFAEYGTN